MAAGPAAEPAPQRPQRARRIGRWQLLGLLLVCAAPVAASYFTYYVVRPEARRNFGELVQPLRPMPADLAVQTLDGQPRKLGELRDQWLLVSVAGGACDADCRNNLYLQRQLRETMGREKERLDWIWLVTDDAAPPADITPALTQATVLRVDGAKLAQWLAPQAGHALSEHLYVFDPIGQWMMR
ncbi:MAG: hypothetical protein JSR53_12255, partial [Proteobacteria bacterium]|nr:hypothetical protein [Pseudomonadota bacterium]